MKEYIRFYESLPVCVDREELHRQIRLALNEQNLGKEEKTFFSMVEDMYCMVQLNSTLCKELQKSEKGGQISEESKDIWQSAMESTEKMLEKWETALLKMH